MSDDYPETHVIIIGGTSVNEPRHDASPFNFINSGCWKAKKYKKGTVRVLFYAPSYETRALHQKKESPKVDPSKLILHKKVGGIDRFHWGCGPDKDYFLKVVQNSQALTGFALTSIRGAADLTAELKKFRSIETMEYFGHSNFEKFLLNFGIDGSPVARDTWGAGEAASVPKGRFAKGAKFISFGCYQGRSTGLAEQLRSLWGIEAVGAEEKTDFDRVVPPRWLPASKGKWYRYLAPASGTTTSSTRAEATIPAD